VEDVFSQLTISTFLSSLGQSQTSVFSATSSILAAHRGLWADNGDALSKIYAGTGALNTSVTRSGKRSFASLISDASKSVGRAIQATFNDSDKQASIELFLVCLEDFWEFSLVAGSNRDCSTGHYGGTEACQGIRPHLELDPRGSYVKTA
jgi:hypothetical protein